MTEKTKDMGASVRARLLQLAKQRGEDFQLVLTRYASERLLYRLSQSEYKNQFVLKGASLFTLWKGQPHRATRDIDLLGFGDPSEDHINSVFRAVLSTESVDDGILFDLDSMTVGPIRVDLAYGGVRVTLNAYVSKAKIRIQVDVGFGDVVTPDAESMEFPTLLDFPAPRLRAYPRETVVAEKLEAMVKLGMANSRMKDFYDIVFLSESFAFDGELLAGAIAATFTRRQTPRPTRHPVALTSEFADDSSKNTQWNAFIRKTGAQPMGDLPSVIETITRFVYAPLITQDSFAHCWPPGGPWNR